MLGFKTKIVIKCRGKLWKHGAVIRMAQIGSSYGIMLVFTCIYFKEYCITLY